MSQSNKEELLNWLRDAHAMEKQAINMLSGVEGRMENYPEFSRVLERNEAIARENQEDLAACISRLGGDTSSIKDMGAQAMGTAQAFSGVILGDEVMKAALSLHAVQNLAIASYEVLITAAEACGETQCQAICESILDREKEISASLRQELPALTRSYLSRKAASDGGAKR